MSSTIVMSLCLALPGLVANIVHEGFRQYCESEAFIAQCDDNEAVVMETASYGRMRLGKCITQAFDHMPCQTDVLDVMDQWCSGRRSCDVMVSDLVHQTRAPCPIDFRSYLEASYTCVPVIQSQQTNCLSHSAPQLIERSSGYMSNAVALETGCGSNASPWLLRVPVGQRIRFTLLDFSLRKLFPRGQGVDDGNICMVFATIKESVKSPTKTVCGGRARNSYVHTSTTNEVEVRLRWVEPEQRIDDDLMTYFLLQFEAIGCADPEIPEYSHLQRFGVEAIVSCNASSDNWRLTCEANRWRGESGTCPPVRDTGAVGNSRTEDGDSMIPGELSIVIIVGIAVLVGLGILITGIICIRRRRLLHSTPRTVTTNQYPLTPTKKYFGDDPEKYDDCPYYSDAGNSYSATWKGQGPKQGHGTPSSYTGNAVPSQNDPIQRNSKNGDHVYESPHFERRVFAPVGHVTPKIKEHTDRGKSFEMDPKMSQSKGIEGTRGILDNSVDNFQSYMSGRYST